MLVVTRKHGQKIIVNNDIEIMILDIKGDQVRIGINAPKNISIYRQEVYEEICNANKEAAINQSAGALSALAKRLK